VPLDVPAVDPLVPAVDPLDGPIVAFVSTNFSLADDEVPAVPDVPVDPADESAGCRHPVTVMVPDCVRLLALDV
jgi:hypothetical protein